MVGLKEYINEIPLVDVHTHIDFRNPTAKKPQQILLYHYIVTELRSLGIPVEEAISKSEDPVGKLIKYFKLIKNTTTYWCLRQILSDLYGFDEEPKPDNWRKLKETIVSRFSDQKWAHEIRKKTKVEKIFLTINPLTELKPEFDRGMYVASLRLDPLVGRLSKESIGNLERITGGNASNLEKFRDLLAQRFEAFKSSTVTIALSIQSFESYKPTHKILVEEAYRKLYAGESLSRADRAKLRSGALSTVLDLCREYKLPIQIMVGVARGLPGSSPPDLAICFKQRGLRHLCYFFHEYSDVDFHLISAYRFQSHELTIIAKNYPNVYLTGYWWYCFFPESIIQHLLERIQLLPMGKMCGFFSDAYVLEWIYGKASLARKITAEALEQMVKKGFYTENLAEEIAEHLFLKNAKNLFNL